MIGFLHGHREIRFCITPGVLITLMLRGCKSRIAHLFNVCVGGLMSKKYRLNMQKDHPIPRYPVKENAPRTPFELALSMANQLPPVERVALVKAMQASLGRERLFTATEVRQEVDRAIHQEHRRLEEVARTHMLAKQLNAPRIFTR